MMSRFVVVLVRPVLLLWLLLALGGVALAADSPKPFGTNLFQGDRKSVV